jgi:hypothetical protein
MIVGIEHGAVLLFGGVGVCPMQPADEEHE